MKLTLRTTFRSLSGVGKEVVTCRACPRLVRFREGVAPRAAFRGERYWRRPVPGFGDPEAELVVVGLAPAAHGGNRTGRVFTGDGSGRFLVKALCAAGFANQSVSESRDDGLVYTKCYVTAAVKCAPPGDRPTGAEFANCSGYLDAELALLKRAKVVLALGSMAFRAVVDSERKKGRDVSGMRFIHGASYPLAGGRRLYAGYHPSPRNTNTGKLTGAMLVSLLQRIKAGITSE
ncbi:MAG: uracil-DNA glycosylase [Nitrososphaerales archaeon]|nr:uracil-DNA glycosylase [Nitrososphaerales archaeon]